MIHSILLKKAVSTPMVALFSCLGFVATAADIAMDSPLDGATYTTSEGIPLAASVSDPDDVKAIRFRVKRPNGTIDVVHEDKKSPYEKDLTGLPAGEYEFWARWQLKSDDAVLIDSDRVTESDRPGQDRQQSTGAALRWSPTLYTKTVPGGLPWWPC